MDPRGLGTSVICPLENDKDTCNLEVKPNQIPRLCYTLFKGCLGLIQTHPPERQHKPCLHGGGHLTTSVIHSTAESWTQSGIQSWGHHEAHGLLVGNATVPTRELFILSQPDLHASFSCFPNHYRLEAAHKRQGHAKVNTRRDYWHTGIEKTLIILLQTKK